MIFNKLFGIEKINNNQLKINYREAVRAVIILNNKILMVHSNKGDYKFPGGGVKIGENHEEALKRETKEETGYIIDSVKDKIGIVVERNPDEYEKDSIFEMTSHYYLCELTGEQTVQQLDDYEAELNFCPVWIHLDEAICENESLMEQKDKNDWVPRETYVLKQLRHALEKR